VGSKNKAQTLGYWYRPVWHMGLSQGPIDAFLELRGGDRTAWQGQMEASGEVYVDAMNLWGGEKKEGGIAGYVDVMFGDADQEPNDYLAKHLGPDQTAYRGRASVVFKGGRFGAMNPYPKPVAFKYRRIFNGWDDQCWYAEKAAIVMGGQLPTPVATDSVTGAGAGSFVHYVAGGVTKSLPAKVLCRMETDDNPTIAGDVMRTRLQITDSDLAWDTGWIGPAALQEALDAQLTAQGLADLIGPITDSDHADHIFNFGVPTDVAYTREIWIYNVGATTSFQCQINWYTLAPGLMYGMNPAHILVDCLVAQNMQGEPTGLINEDSFRAAADRLYAEGFGLCVEYDPGSEDLDEFRQRICNIISASCTRSRVDGRWNLNLIRGAGDPSALPILTDDNILDFEQDPSTLDDAVNQVTVEWFDPERKEKRATAPLQSLGAIQAIGAVVPETLTYPEIPAEGLANRVAARDLRAKSPGNRLTLTTDRTPYSWSTGTYFRLQAPRRGIADMVCLVADIDAGTLRSGAIKLIAIEDVFSMPDTTYVGTEPPPPAGDDAPTVPKYQRLIELPYLELVQALARSDLDALPPDVGYAGAVAVRPTVGTEYWLYMAPIATPLQEGGVGHWAPAVQVEGAATPPQTDFIVKSGSDLDRIEVGTAVLWGEEICRVDALDPEAKTISLGRGCADTVPAAHAENTVICFYDQWLATDGQEYADGETVEAKILPISATQVLPPFAAPPLQVTIVGRHARPYPPARVRVNADPFPSYLFGELTLAWVHRDRLLQADQLVDNEAAAVGPEPGTTYTVRWYRNSVLEHTDSALSGTSQTYSPASDGRMRIELEAVRDGLVSWQKQVREFDYTVVEAEVLELEAGGLITTESDESITLD
jgi:hypothetical protein